MLKKLLKYEFIATSRTFGAVYLAVAVASVLLGGYFGSDARWDMNGLAGAVGTILALVYMAAVMALVAVTIISVVQRFQRNLLGREGYLMHTLPVTEGQLIFSKLVVGLAWSVCSALMGAASLVLVSISLIFSALLTGSKAPVIYNDEVHSIGDLWRSVGALFHALTSSWYAHFTLPIWQAALILTVMLLAVGCSLMLCIYAACMVGHQSKRHPKLLGLAAFCVLFVAQKRIENLFYTTGFSFTEGVLHFSLLRTAGASPWAAMLLYAAVNLVFSVVYFALTNWLMKRHLNLE